MSANTGGPASEKTLLDEFAGQALPWCLGEFAGNPEDGTQYAEAAYQIASAMLAEKARREAVVQESSTTQDAGKVVELQAANRELVEALESFKHADGCYCEAAFSGPNGTQPRHSPECEKARAILAKHKGAA